MLNLSFAKASHLPFRMRFVLLLSLIVGLLAPFASAQAHHSRDPLVLGQPATFQFSNLPLLSFGVVLFSTGGAGNGACFPAPWSTCLGVLDPILIGPQLPSDFLGRARFDLVVSSTTSLYPVATQGLWVDLSGANARFVVSNVVECSIEDLSALDDSFDVALGAGWSLRDSSRVHATVDNRELLLEPTANARWLDDDEGPQLWRRIRGDFAVTTRARAFDPARPGSAPPPSARFGGLLLRDPRSVPGQRNWAAIAIGSGDAATPVALTAIATLASHSVVTMRDANAVGAAPTAELQLVRRGERIECQYRQSASAAFVTIASVTLPGLPLDVEVGPFVSVDDVPPELGVAFDAVHFASR